MNGPDLSWMIGRGIVQIRKVEPISWWFDLAGGGNLRVDTLWRLVAQGRVQASSTDHAQTFGLPKPVDSVARANLGLANSVITRASLPGETGDVLLEFDNDSRLEILTTSSGFESWAICFPNGDEAIGLGGGRVELRKASA